MDECFPAPVFAPRKHPLRGFAWNDDAVPSHPPAMDTDSALALLASRPRPHSVPAPPGVPPVHDWESLLPEAVAIAWKRDPETMGHLLAALLSRHLAGHGESLDTTLDELHLMIAMELQALAGYPD